MAKTIAALDYLNKPEKHAAREVNVVFGDEPYLKRQVLTALTAGISSGDDADFAVTRLAGKSVEWRDVCDELATVSLFGGGRRVVIVEEADDFVSRSRDALERYVVRPNTAGVLVLVATTWPKNTRLFKALADCGLQIECKTPSERVVVGWLAAEAQNKHNAVLAAGAAEQLVEIVGPELGLLDQELAKLALLAGAGGAITPQLVHDMVGGWRAKTAWDMLDAAYAGNTREALLQLQRLIHAGEHPIAILGQIASSLRRFAAAATIFTDAEATGRRMPLRPALEQAGVQAYFLRKAEEQLKRMGRERALTLNAWLLEADLALKGSSSAPDRARLVLEKLLVRIASPREAHLPARAK